MKNKRLLRILALALSAIFVLSLCSCFGDSSKNDSSTDTNTGSKTVTLKFNANGGEIVEGKKKITATVGEKFKKSQLPEVEREGYEFECWEDEDGDEIDIPFIVPNENTTYYARWKEADGSSSNIGSDTSINSGTSSDSNSESDTNTDGDPSDNYAENNSKIMIGLSGPLTGGAAMYGIAVKNSIEMAIEEINANGGFNGIEFDFLMLDDKHDANNISTNYASLYESGMQVSLGTVTTKPGLQFKKYSQADNVFFLTPSATGDAIPEFANGYQMCFSDSNQGIAAAKTFNDIYKGKKIGIFYKDDDDYSVGIKNKFLETIDSSFDITIASFNDATAIMFTQQVYELKDCDVIFMPIYYTPASLFMKQGNGIVKANAIYYGCDGLDGIDAVEGFDISSITQGVSYLSHFNISATEGAAKTYIDAYKAKYGTDAPRNQFGASAYDCVYAIFEAMKFADSMGIEIKANISPSELCEILKKVFDNEYFSYRGITGLPEIDGKSTITWTDKNGNPTGGYVNKYGVLFVVKEVTY